MAMKEIRAAWRRHLKRQLNNNIIKKVYGPKFIGSTAQLESEKPQSATIRISDHSYDYRFDKIIIDLVNFSAVFYLNGKYAGATDLMGLDVIDVVEHDLDFYLEWDCINV